MNEGITIYSPNNIAPDNENRSYLNMWILYKGVFAFRSEIQKTLVMGDWRPWIDRMVALENTIIYRLKMPDNINFFIKSNEMHLAYLEIFSVEGFVNDVIRTKSIDIIKSVTNQVSPRGDNIKFSMDFFKKTFNSMMNDALVQERLRGNDGIQLCELAIENLQKATQKTEMSEYYEYLINRWQQQLQQLRCKAGKVENCQTECEQFSSELVNECNKNAEDMDDDTWMKALKEEYTGRNW